MKTVVIKVELNDTEALAFAQFLKRASFSDYRTNAVDEAEAYQMIGAGAKVQRALAEKGYAPR